MRRFLEIELSLRTHISRTLLGLAQWVSIPTTYAGGAKGNNKLYGSPPLHSPPAQDLSDLDLVNHLSNGKVDLTYGRCVQDLYSILNISIETTVRWIFSAESS